LKHAISTPQNDPNSRPLSEAKKQIQNHPITASSEGLLEGALREVKSMKNN
jgi:hypothetical protein